MTHVEIYEKESEWSVSVLGHAGYADQGKDIVCAAISILTGTMVQMLRDVALEKKEEEISPGCVKIRFKARKGTEEEVKIIVNTILTGFLLLENSYRNHINVNYRL